MVPVVLPMLAVARVPNGAAGVIALDDSVVADDNVVAVLPAVDGETVLATVDDIGAGAVMEGGGGAGIPGGCGAGTVGPGMGDMNDGAGCADSGRNGVLPGAAVE